MKTSDDTWKKNPTLKRNWYSAILVFWIVKSFLQAHSSKIKLELGWDDCMDHGVSFWEEEMKCGLKSWAMSGWIVTVSFAITLFHHKEAVCNNPVSHSENIAETSLQGQSFLTD